MQYRFFPDHLEIFREYFMNISCIMPILHALHGVSLIFRMNGESLALTYIIDERPVL